MVSRKPAARKILDLQNAKSAAAWIRSFVAKCCVEKKKGKDEHQWYPDSQQTEIFWIYRMQNQLLRGLCLLWLNVA